MDLGRRAGNESGIDRWAQGGCPVGKSEARAGDDDAALGPCAAVPMQQLHRHRIEHLVADHHTTHRVGQGVKPAHAIAKRR
jgi:hypothetical protein